MVGWHHQLDGREFEQAPGVGDGQGILVGCSLWVCKESDKTDQLNNCNQWILPSVFPMPCWKWGFSKGCTLPWRSEGWLLWLRGLHIFLGLYPLSLPAISHLFPYIHPDFPDTPSSEKDFQLPMWWRAPSCLGLSTPLFGALCAPVLQVGSW